MKYFALLLLAACKGAESPQAVEVSPADPGDAQSPALEADATAVATPEKKDADVSDPLESTNVPAKSPSVKGGLDTAAVSKVIAAHMGALRACYNKKLAVDPSSAGKVIVAWDISPAGRVINVKVVSSTFPDADVPTCLEKQISNFTFPAAGSPTQIGGLPLVFVSSHP